MDSFVNYICCVIPRVVTVMACAMTVTIECYKLVVG